MLEREVKLAAPPAFTLPDLDDLAAAIETTPVDEQRLETVYYDTPDLRLARWGCNLRLRHGEGWTLKLPTTGDGPVLARRELEFSGDASRPPDAAVALVIGYTRRSALVPVATLSTLRRRVQQIIDEKTGMMMRFRNEAIVLEGVVCHARYSKCRRFCPRSIYPYWREIWLKRIEGDSSTAGAMGQR